MCVRMIDDSFIPADANHRRPLLCGAVYRYWLDKIDASKITVPAWAPLEELHPCDFQSSMLKGCIPPADEKAVFYAADRRRLIIQIYFAMIAEYDAMVGESHPPLN